MAVKRLSKVARELNVGISTIVDFLNDNGHEIESSPNTKVEGEVYELLLKEFMAEKEEKEKSKETIAKKIEKREAISLKNQEEEEKVVEEKASEVIKANAGKLSGPSVVGKIDLSSSKKATKKEEPKKKIEEKKEEPIKEEAKKSVVEKKEEVVAEVKSAKEQKTPTKEAKKEEVEEKPVEEKAKTALERNDGSVIKVDVKKLSGPTVLGKIELPKQKEKPKKDFKKQEDEKRKRKRIKKVNIEKAGARVAKKERTKKSTEVKKEVSKEEIEKELKQTLARLSGGGKSKASKNRREKRQLKAQQREQDQIEQEAESKVLKLTEFSTVSDLASMMNVSVNEVISACMSLGIFVSINQRIDAETITIISDEFGFAVDFVSAEVQDSIEEIEDSEESLEHRPPIVTVMGHVDHGKTSLLDYIRSARVASGEAGGITQHIGAYSVTGESGRKITFLDTPGHEAFTAMRARGAQVTDIAIIIIAADDQVMPQTKEAINHAQAAEVPMVFAINKIDKPGANPDKIREQLATMNILVEEWGGKFQCEEISAKSGHGIEELLEKVLLEAEMLNLKANPDRQAVGTVVESSLDKGRGYVTNLLVEKGTLRIGDIILAGQYSGRVKAMNNEHMQSITEAGPASPVSILGFNGAPTAGDRFNVFEDEKEARQIATKREQLQREQGVRTQKHITLDEIGRRLAIGDFQELNIIIKGDVDGSVEALSDSMLKLSTDQIQVNIIHKAVGAITESDVLLATASDAIIVGFQVRPTAQARRLAENEEIDIRMYSIIYKAIEEIKSAMEGMLSPDIVEEITGTCEIREVFKISKVGTIAGCFVIDGKLYRNAKVRVIRDGIVIYTGELGSLKRFKDDVKEVNKGFECGLNIEKFNDIKVGDHVESFREVEVARKL